MDDEELLEEELEEDDVTSTPNSAAWKAYPGGTGYTNVEVPAWDNSRYKLHSIQVIRYKLNVRNASDDGWNGDNSWASWGLISASRPVINPPSPKTSFSDIPGFHGSLDFSELLTGYPIYSDRSGSLDFYVAATACKNEYWETAYRRIIDYCHGQKLKVMLFDDTDHYYVGRMAVNNWKSNKDYSQITIDYRFEPFMYSVSTGLVDDNLATNTPRDQTGRLTPSVHQQAEGVNF